ncbi:MAG: hypothetical protein IJB74_08565 [Clostridia bacterium]|nr:hypothetical protein [Clostridia bacterium]
MKRLIKSEKFIYIVIAAVFICAFLTVFLKTEHKLDALRESTPVIIHDVTLKEVKEEKRTVYVTPSGKKYHLDGCDYLSGNKMEISEKDAINSGFEACAYCQP